MPNSNLLSCGADEAKAWHGLCQRLGETCLSVRQDWRGHEAQRRQAIAQFPPSSDRLPFVVKCQSQTRAKGASRASQGSQGIGPHLMGRAAGLRLRAEPMNERSKQPHASPSLLPPLSRQTSNRGARSEPRAKPGYARLIRFLPLKRVEFRCELRGVAAQRGPEAVQHTRGAPATETKPCSIGGVAGGTAGRCV